MERRVLLINPNTDAGCTAGIARAVAPYARPGAIRFDTVALPGGPSAVATWRDWFSVALPLCDLVARSPADAYVIACVSDPGLEAVREVTDRPVLGPFRCAVAAALARADRFGVIAFVEASKARQRRVLQAVGAGARLAATEALNLPMTALTDGTAARAALIATARRLAAAGSDVVILGCAGMADHRRAVEDAAGIPVIEPMAAAAAQALVAVGDAPLSGAPAGPRQRSVEATA
ncbi:aspartate/glutamate racemase family protein [Roseomonas sp. CCTCC AB2023176]|uniref:aspartate/glutamate racemase family protein n=1 Tax=Roseomonas sp. CCTCC AB2023176 TaxID=3342640 RepID=UPI0035DFF49F